LRYEIRKQEPLMSDSINLAEFKELLLARREELLSVQKGHEKAAETVELDQSKVGRVSRMDALQQQAMSAAAGQRARLELAAIEAALRRIDSGEYGFCVTCGEDIAEKRLRANPAVVRCINCARSKERF
jgi:DnaK suppressor protein